MGGNINNKTNKNGATNKAKTNPATKPAPVVNEKKKKNGTEIFLIVFAIIAVLGIVASIVIGIIVSSKKNKVFDYMKDDLSKYITVSGDYKNFTVEVNTDPVEDIDIEHEILKAIYKNRNEKPEDGGKGFLNVPISAGDIATIYYRGYTLEDGKRVDFDGGCNFSGSPTQLGIGSGQFMTGFELGLIGKNPAEYSSLKIMNNSGKIGKDDKIFIVYTKSLNDKTTTSVATAIVDLSLGKDEIDKKWGTLFYSSITEADRYYGQEFKFNVETDNGGEIITMKAYRTTSENQLISVTYSAFMANGDVIQGKTALIDLSDPDLDSKYGSGFRQFFIDGVPVGTKVVNEENKAKTLNTEVETESGKGKNSYYDITVSKVYEVGDKPLTIEVCFTTDYHTEALRGKTAYFDVYVDSVIIYNAKYSSPADIDDAFITETLKMTAEDLKDYEGESLVDKYRAKIRADLVETYENTKTQTINNALLQHYVKCATVKKFPDGEVQSIYDQYYSDIESQYAQYSAYYGSIDAFAREYLSLASNADWKAELKRIAEEAVTQKLVFYYIMRAENAVIPEEEFKKRFEERFNEVFEMYLGNVGCKPDKYDTQEKYEEERAKHYETFSSYYGEDYFRDNITYEYAFEKLSTLEGITIKEQSDKYNK